jgi:polysaccharide export outer membrane protein
MNCLFKALAATAMVLLTACASSPALVGGPDVSVTEAGALPAPRRADFVGQARDYVIGPFDKLTVKAFGIENLEQAEIQVDASGNMAFPLVGDVRAAGLTPSELARVIEAGLRRSYVRDPNVIVNLDETVSQVVAIEGQVGRPGLYPVVGQMTLLRAVARAEGLTEFARDEHVVIMRKVGGQQYAALYNLNQIRNGAMADPDIYANDVVLVGESRGRRIFKDILQASPILTSPIVAILNQR